MIAYMLYAIFDSFFLGFMALTFFVFVPLPDEDAEAEFSAVLFTVLMLLILLLAFYNGEMMGLGLDFPEWVFSGTAGVFRGIVVGLFFLAAVARAVIFAPKGVSRVVGRFHGRAGDATERGLSAAQNWATGGLPSGIFTFGAIALFVLLIFLLQPWTWSPEVTVFMGIWTIAFLTGSMTGDIQSRQVFGVIMVFLSFTIFSMGIGTQQVGSAFFGEWWPSVFQFGETTLKPIGEQFSQLTSGLSLGISLITDPTGFAQRIMSGQYQTDPTTGLRGAYGVELEQFKTTPIYVGQGYSISMNLNNKGAFEATAVRAGVAIDELKAPVGEVSGEYMNVFDLGFTTADFGGQDHCREVTGEKGRKRWECWRWMDDNPDNKLTKLDIRQVFFGTTEGIGCTAYNDFIQPEEGTRRGIPLMGFVEYDYEIESSLQVEFMNASEWDRRVLAGEAVVQAKKPSTLSNAPVQLNLDTPDQPIREGSPYYLAIQLVEGPRGGNISGITSIKLDVPEDLALDPTRCSPSSTNFEWYETDFGPKGPYLIYCPLGPIEGITQPTETYVIKATATYTFKKYTDMLAAVGFAAGCCKDEDCIEGQVCFWDGSKEKPGECRYPTED